MLKRGKRNRLKEEKLENLEEETKAEETVETSATSTNNLAAEIEKASETLFYVSETDAEISIFVGQPAAAVNGATLLAQIKSAGDTPVEERNFTEFFARLTEVQDWFGDEETETAKKFARLKEVLEKNLRDLKVFKVGKIQLDVYVVGLESENVLMGVKTQAVET